MELSQNRIEYLRKLIVSIRDTIANDPENIEATKLAGEPVLNAKWVDIELLCHVIEEEILNACPIERKG